ncbi:Protein disulfide-isomerase [Wickerhamiella sorbophila]|uniref:Protein disulfide-isomerase n=1 Tax=Wickerhamiella sorbophila TaxID=45607 RepID=A0A2T0FC20_9ASCO|nr:Protein disulfide-isomerase [Wickerhamiella sorbophila]PRT52548.1 Protein disulfide-isomerase [Wickerhamiella sorbophila]
MKWTNFAVALFASTVRAAGASADASDVLVLNSENFESVLAENPLVLVEFYAPWCGHCKNLAPEYEKAATTLKDESIVLAKVDCTENQALCANYNIAGYPTLKVFRGESNSDFRGGRQVDSIVSAMRRQNTPLLTDITSKNLDEVVDSSDYVALAFFDKKSQDKKDLFKDAAETYRERLRAGVSDDKKLASKYGAKVPGLVMFKKGEEPAVYDGDFSAEDVDKFLNSEAFAAFTELTPHNFQAYAESGLPLLYVFVTSEAELKEVGDYLAPMLKTTKGVINAAWLNGTAYKGHVEILGLEDKFPAMIIHDMAANLKFPHDQTNKLTKASVASYLKKFVAGELKPKLKSAPVPESQDGPVYILVGDEFESVVTKGKKDALVEFYAPWCGYCKKMSPVYDQLGLAFADSNVVIAKLDHTENDVPLPIRSYPTIYFFRAGEKEPILYEGTRTLEDMAEFIKTHSTSDINVAELLEKLSDADVEFESESDSGKHDEL